MITFALLITLLCVGVWFSVRKNVEPTADTCLHHSPSGDTVKPVKKDQPKDKSQTAQPAAAVAVDVPVAAPTNAEAFPGPDRRKNERWYDWLALSTTIFALIAVIMALEATKASMLAVLSSGKESFSWAVYEAKSVKEHTFQAAKAELELQLEGIPGLSAEAADKYRKAIKKYDEELKRYKDEKEEISEEALTLGKTKEKYQRRSVGFSNSLIFLQIAIILSSIAIMVRKKYIWYISFFILAGWFYFFVNSF